jgi:transposase InsO family protein
LIKKTLLEADTAVAVRGGQVPGVIFHSDRGSEYTACAFRAACQRLHGSYREARTGTISRIKVCAL